MIFKVRINGKEHNVDSDPDMPLLWLLRNDLGLTGAKFGCGKGLCGACTVLLNGKAIRSCSVPVRSIGSLEVTTIEGISPAGQHPVQQAWMECDVPQCGYCQAGQIMSTVALLNRNAVPSEKEIESALAGNLCRCGTYTRIMKAVKLAAEKINQI
jgi:isoquinoline 1-oxidoreductase alpha subunit